MTRCLACGTSIHKGERFCSRQCKRDWDIKDRRRYEATQKHKRREANRNLNCIACGKRLGHPGRYCKNHNFLYQREYRRNKLDKESRTQATT